MERRDDIERFYFILGKLKDKIGFRRLSNCDGAMGWPGRGVYFFFEQGEIREGSNDLRVVRVGPHGLKEDSSATLWGRLRQHRGNISGDYKDGGNHRGSIFRLHVGTAIINQQNLHSLTWGKGSSASREIRKAEYLMECKVSRVIRDMPFLWLKIEDPAGPSSMRGYIERNTIALLSNYQRQPIDTASKAWLGNYCAHAMVRNSHLWNVEHAADEYNPAYLTELEHLVHDM